jgi:hypothetical protein
MNTSCNTITIFKIEDFTQQVINGNLVLTRINPFIEECTLFQKDLRGSVIIDCKINNEFVDVKKYKKLLLILYSTTDVETILQNTILNISKQEIYEKGFEYYNQLGLSIQGSDARRTLKEIIIFLKLKSYNMDLTIKLKSDETVRFMI